MSDCESPGDSAATGALAKVSAFVSMTKPQKRKTGASMITQRKLIEFVLAEPFRPFRIHMASGQTFDVRHPENVAVSRSSVRIFAPVDDSTADERWHDVSLMLMESVEPLDASVTQDQN